jgi:hypothetical protein
MTEIKNSKPRIIIDDPKVKILVDSLHCWPEIVEAQKDAIKNKKKWLNARLARYMNGILLLGQKFLKIQGYAYILARNLPLDALKN